MDRNKLFSYLGTLGAAALVAGLLLYSVYEVMSKWYWALIIGGAILLVIWVVGNFGNIVASAQKRSTRLGANALVASLAAIAIFGVVNYLGYKKHKKFDLTAEKLFTLSDQTKKVLGELKTDVKVLFFSKTDEPVASLVEQYRDFSNRVTYERIDLQARPEMAMQFRGVRPGETIVAANNRNEKVAAVDEQSLTSAIMKVTREQAKTVCFLEGHGERELSGGGPEGYLQTDNKLKADNYATKTISLLNKNEIPAECSILVVAGPKKALLPGEVETLSKWMDAGGKMLLGVDPDSEADLDAFLKNWAIELHKDTVIDYSAIGQLSGAGAGVPLVTDFGAHPITKTFGRLPAFFPLARSLKTDSAKTEVTTTELLKTSTESFGETELQGNQAKMDEGKDIKGPLTLGVAATKKAGAKDARLVVFGDSDFASNAYQRQGANGDLFVNSINWLAEEEDLISIRPKSQTNRDVQLSSVAQNLLFWIIIFMPLAVIVTGISIWWKRR
ncbi:MAG TPA: GldG family protein [Blastocatellia bacterium]|nr:GldG family protein [Blastocatellia bacterium]